MNDKRRDDERTRIEMVGLVNGGNHRLAEIYEKCIDLLGKDDLYRWHDLRKDPTDLPKEGGYYLCIYDFGEDLIIPKCLIWQKENDFGIPLGWRSNTDWIFGGSINRLSMIAWREIEEPEG